MIVHRLDRSTQSVVSVDEIKERGRLNDDEPDGPLQMIADAVVVEAEDYAQIALLSQTVRVTLASWPGDALFRLPIAPLVDGETVTVSVDGREFSQFTVITGPRPALIWSGDQPRGAVVIEYIAGYGASPDDIPGDLRLALIDQAALYVDSRGLVDANDATCSPQFLRILSRYRGVRA